MLTQTALVRGAARRAAGCAAAGDTRGGSASKGGAQHSSPHTAARPPPRPLPPLLSSLFSSYATTIFPMRCSAFISHAAHRRGGREDDAGCGMWDEGREQVRAEVAEAQVAKLQVTHVHTRMHTRMHTLAHACTRLHTH
eukprot:3936652-Rhodomonas_salina.2